jgi:hypothetical protein
VIYLVVRLTWVPGKAADGSEYERAVLRFWIEHGGDIVAAFKPLAQADGLPPADEVQILRIPTQSQMDAYLSDPRRLALAPKRAASIAVTGITISDKLVES